MYRYDDLDQALLNQRTAEFRQQVERRLSGELTEEQFKPLRLMNGLYLQLHAYMLRVAIPYGTLSSDQMRMLAHIARTYDQDYGHFTTRQNIQYNWVKLKDAPAILEDLASVQMHAIQTSGNTIRNTTSDPFAGSAADEVEDPRIWAEIIRQWSTLHPEFQFLPRKFKIAVIASDADRAAMKFHDIGIKLVLRDGSRGFEIYAGGGQGRTPMVAPLIHPFIEEHHFLPYLDSILRVYNRHGRRDNIYKARIKILVDALGVEEFTRQVAEEFELAKTLDYDFANADFDRVKAMFRAPELRPEPAAEAEFAAARAKSRALGLWAKSSIHPHKIPGYGIVTISLKPIGGIPGDASSAQMDVIADLADRFSLSEVRVTYTQNLVLPNVRLADMHELWTQLDKHGLATANVGLTTDIIACPGLDYCALANARSIPIAQSISERFADLDRQHDIGPLGIKISGCINACGHHHAGHIGILGVDKRGDERYQLTLGGEGDGDAAIGKITGPGFDEDGIVDAVETVIDAYLDLRTDNETFIQTLNRVGHDPFKEKLYGPR